MKYALLCGCLLFAGCEVRMESDAIAPDVDLLKGVAAIGHYPWRTLAPVEIPPVYREQNYAGGSCMWASLETVLRSQGQLSVAAWCRQNCRGAAGVSDCARVADKVGLRYAVVTNGDADFLAWCSRTRRAAAIHWQGGEHAVTFCGYNLADEAVLIDNNRTGQYQRIPKAQFLAEWRRSGGCAFTVLYWSPPARPWYVPS